MDICFTQEGARFKYRVCAVITSGERLLVMRDEISPYYYLPGGKVRLGETAEDAMLREIKEELLLDARIVRPLWIVQSFYKEDVNGFDYHELCFYFLIDVSGADFEALGDRFTFQEGERVNSFEWMDFSRLTDAYMYPEFIKKEIFSLPEDLTLKTVIE